MESALDPEILMEGELVPAESSALAEITRAEYDIQIATAKKYPRSITRFKRRTEELACLDEDTAATMFYCMPRGGKTIEGPSVRFAEVVGSTWGNLRYGARVVQTDDKFITAQGACHDLETNNAVSIEIKRRITDKNGKKYNDDMIQVTGNAACSIALRQAIFKVVPFALAKDIYEKARQTAVGKATTMAETRAKAVQWFTKAGATEAQVFAFLERTSIEDLTMDDVIKLRGLVTAIKDGETTIEEALNVQPPEPKKRASVVETPKSTPKPEQSAGPLSAFRAEVEACTTHGKLDAVEERWINGPDAMLPAEARKEAIGIAAEKRRTLKA